MHVTSEDPKTLEVIVRARTVIRLEDLVLTITSSSGTEQTVRVREAEVHWDYEVDHWVVDFVQIQGPVLRKDGSDGKKLASISTHPPESARAPAIPPEVLAVALENAPDWTPELNDPGWARTAPGWSRSSF